MRREPKVQIELPEAIYSLFNTERSGKPAVVVVNGALGGFEHHDIFPWQLSIVMNARDLAPNGMPTKDETQVLDSLGDGIEAALMRGTTEHGALNVLFLARITWNGARQLLYRVHNPKLVDAELKRLTAQPNAREWSYEMSGDEDWSEAEVVLELLSRTDA